MEAPEPQHCGGEPFCCVDIILVNVVFHINDDRIGRDTVDCPHVISDEAGVRFVSIDNENAVIEHVKMYRQIIARASVGDKREHVGMTVVHVVH